MRSIDNLRQLTEVMSPLRLEHLVRSVGMHPAALRPAPWSTRGSLRLLFQVDIGNFSLSCQ